MDLPFPKANSDNKTNEINNNSNDDIIGSYEDFTKDLPILSADIKDSKLSLLLDQILSEDTIDEIDWELEKKPTAVTKEEGKKNQCPVCNRLFKHSYTLKRHLPIHSDKREFHCGECGKSFRQFCTLSQHRAVHSINRPYKCEYCAKSFNRVSTLISHRKIHTTVKPFRCYICSKSFHQKGNLRNHLYIHTNLKPYRCVINNCNAGFNQMSNLVSHQQKMHSTVVENKTTWQCHRCEACFPRRNLLKAHQFEEHQMLETKPIVPLMPLASAPTQEQQPESATIVHRSTPSVSTGIVIGRVETEAMKTAVKRNELPFGVLHLLQGTPLLVRIVTCGPDKSLLRPANQTDFEMIKVMQKATSTDQVKIAIVATITQLAPKAGVAQFSVMPPKITYKIGAFEKHPTRNFDEDGPFQSTINSNDVNKTLSQLNENVPPCTNFENIIPHTITKSEAAVKTQRKIILTSPKRMISKSAAKAATSSKVKKPVKRATVPKQREALRLMTSTPTKRPPTILDNLDRSSSRCSSESLWRLNDSMSSSFEEIATTALLSPNRIKMVSYRKDWILVSVI
jgi:hypothetical protein